MAKKLSVKLVAAWFFGISFLLSGLSSLIEGSIISSISLLLASALLLPPIYKKISKKIKLTTPLKIIVIIVLLFISGMAMPAEISDEEGTSEVIAPIIEKKVEPVEEEKATLEVKLISTSQRYSIGSEFLGTLPDGNFIIVTFEITNNGKSTKTIMSDRFVLQDDQGFEWTDDSEATLYLSMERMNNYKTFSVIEEIGPKHKITRTLVFDIPSSVDADSLNFVFKSSLSASMDTLLGLY